MVLADWVWLVALLPLAAFLLITLGGRRLRRPDVVAGVAMAVAFLVSLGVLRGVALGAAPEWHAVWATFGQTTVGLGYRIDALSSVMLAIITFVSLMVQIYSMGYMHGDARYRRYYGVLSLFSAAMIALVMADDLLGLFIAWELVGLCSYLLIGHWYEQAEVRYAAIKAFIVTRIGDVALLLGLFVVFAATGSLSFAAIHAAVASGAIAGPVITAAALLIFGGAVGKSAQFPLHV